jgi:hypothetical protein
MALSNRPIHSLFNLIVFIRFFLAHYARMLSPAFVSIKSAKSLTHSHTLAHIHAMIASRSSVLLEYRFCFIVSFARIMRTGHAPTRESVNPRARVIPSRIAAQSLVPHFSELAGQFPLSHTRVT